MPFEGPPLNFGHFKSMPREETDSVLEGAVVLTYGFGNNCQPLAVLAVF